MEALWIATVERLAKVEVRLDTLVEQVKHIDVCVDSVKRTIWTAAGAVAVVMLLVGWAFK